MNIEYLRTFRLGEYAIFDLTVSFLGIAILSPLLTKLFRLIHLEIPFISWMFLTLPIGILAHILVGNYTKMTTNFLNPSDHYILKIFILILLVLGIKSIKLIRWRYRLIPV